MKTALFQLLGGLLLAAIATVTVFASKPASQHCDLVIRNIEALTQSELPPKINCKTQKDAVCRDKVQDADGVVYDVDYPGKVKA